MVICCRQQVWRLINNWLKRSFTANLAPNSGRKGDGEWRILTHRMPCHMMANTDTQNALENGDVTCSSKLVKYQVESGKLVVEGKCITWFCFSGEPGGPGTVFINAENHRLGKVFVNNRGRIPHLKMTDNCTIYDPVVSGKSNTNGKLDSRLPTTRGGIPFLSMRTELQPWSNFIFPIASQHDLDIGYQGHLGRNKCNGTVQTLHIWGPSTFSMKT